eukprot:EST47702.1 Hypothetical protein SS50377_12098 [Spironucleus salmonicida]
MLCFRQKINPQFCRAWRTTSASDRYITPATSQAKQKQHNQRLTFTQEMYRILVPVMHSGRVLSHFHAQRHAKTTFSRYYQHHDLQNAQTGQSGSPAGVTGASFRYCFILNSGVELIYFIYNNDNKNKIFFRSFTTSRFGTEFLGSGAAFCANLRACGRERLCKIHVSRTALLELAGQEQQGLAGAFGGGSSVDTMAKLRCQLCFEYQYQIYIIIIIKIF